MTPIRDILRRLSLRRTPEHRQREEALDRWEAWEAAQAGDVSAEDVARIFEGRARR